jgi:hypothetical protein
LPGGTLTPQMGCPSAPMLYVRVVSLEKPD